MSPASMIETVNLTKRFAPKTILPLFNRVNGDGAHATPPVVDRVSIKVARGEIVGLMGPNGAGKTTFIKMLATLIAPSAGEAKIDGIPLTTENGAEIKRRIGLVVPDERSFYWRLTGRQNLRFFCALYGYFGQSREQRITELLQLVDLAEASDTRFDRFSSGMKQRLALARGLIHRPSLLFLDEPGRALDQTQKARLQNHIRTINRQEGTTVLMITHDPAAAETVCHRILYMEAGKLIERDASGKGTAALDAK